MNEILENFCKNRAILTVFITFPVDFPDGFVEKSDGLSVTFYKANKFFEQIQYF